jgi:hypothetical protein
MRCPPAAATQQALTRSVVILVESALLKGRNRRSDGFARVHQRCGGVCTHILSEDIRSDVRREGPAGVPEISDVLNVGVHEVPQRRWRATEPSFNLIEGCTVEVLQEVEHAVGDYDGRTVVRPNSLHSS